MRLPKYGYEKILARDKYRNKITLQCNSDETSFDLQTDGRVHLNVRLAKELAAALLEFAETYERLYKRGL